VVVALGARLREELAVLLEDLEVFLRAKLVVTINHHETHNRLTASAMGSPTSSLADWRRSGALAVQRKYPKSLAVPMEWKCSTRAFLSLVRAASLPKGASPVVLLDACSSVAVLLDACSSVAVLLNALAVILVTMACASPVVLLDACSYAAVLLDACSYVAVLLDACSSVAVLLDACSSVAVLLNALVTLAWSSLAVMTNVLAGCCTA
jgi:hypothetical protein